MSKDSQTKYAKKKKKANNEVYLGSSISYFDFVIQKYI